MLRGKGEGAKGREGNGRGMKKEKRGDNIRKQKEKKGKTGNNKKRVKKSFVGRVESMEMRADSGRKGTFSVLLLFLLLILILPRI